MVLHLDWRLPSTIHSLLQTCLIKSTNIKILLFTKSAETGQKWRQSLWFVRMRKTDPQCVIGTFHTSVQSPQRPSITFKINPKSSPCPTSLQLSFWPHLLLISFLPTPLQTNNGVLAISQTIQALLLQNVHSVSTFWNLSLKYPHGTLNFFQVSMQMSLSLHLFSLNKTTYPNLCAISCIVLLTTYLFIC